MSYATPFALQRGSFQQSSPLVDKDVDIMASLERDAGFCSAEDDEELDDLHSPTDVSEDSVEVKVEPISLRNKNKRKCAEPRKVANEDNMVLPPYKKRRHFIEDLSKSAPEDRFHIAVKKSPLLVNDVSTPVATVTPRSCVSPFRPWSHPRPAQSERRNSSPSISCPSTVVSPPPRQYTERVPELPNQDEPLSLVKNHDAETKPRERKNSDGGDKRVDPQPLSYATRTVIKTEYQTVAEHPRKLEIPGYDHRRMLAGDSSADACSELRRLPFSAGVEIKREPGQPSSSNPFTITRPPQEDESCRSSHEQAVDFTMTSALVRQSEPSCSYPRVPESFRGRRTLSEMANDDRVVCNVDDMGVRASQSKFNVDSLLSGSRDIDDRPGSSSTPSMSSDKKNSPSNANQQRNYKNMTRERRVEANARERTRVHTISAAFDTLRRTIPAYSHNQKLSKLSVLRIACSYILTLSRVAGSDYSADSSEPSLADCVDYVSRTIQTEGKLRKKKDE